MSIEFYKLTFYQCNCVMRSLCSTSRPTCTHVIVIKIAVLVSVSSQVRKHRIYHNRNLKHVYFLSCLHFRKIRNNLYYYNSRRQLTQKAYHLLALQAVIHCTKFEDFGSFVFELL